MIKKRLEWLKRGLCITLAGTMIICSDTMAFAAEAANGQNVILFHEAYDYVAEDYGLNVSYVLDLDEERQVSAGEIADVLAAVKKDHVKYILAEELYGKSTGDTIEAESDVKVLYLDPLNKGNYDADSYLEGMAKNMDVLEQYLDR